MEPLTGCVDREPQVTTEPQADKVQQANPDLSENSGCLVRLDCLVFRELLDLPVRLAPLVNVDLG